MTQPDVPQIFTTKDLGITPAVQAPGANGLPQGNDLEGFFKFLDRFLPRMEQFANQLKSLQGIKTPGVTVTGASDDGVTVTGAGGGGGNVNTTPTPQPAKIDPQMVYARVLGYLAQLPPETTAGALLAQAREHKTMIIPMLAAEIAKIQAGE